MEKKVVNVEQDSAKILNAIRADASATYQETVPVALSDGSNIQEIGRAISSYTPNTNEFMNAINRIGRTIIQTWSYTNPLKRFKRGTLSNGETIQELFVGLAKMYDYEWNSGEAEVNPFKREIPDVKQYFHTMNVQKVIEQTVTEEQISLAFTNSRSVITFISQIMQSMFNKYEIFEWERTKQVIGDAYKAGDITKVTLDAAPTDEATTKAFVKKMRTLSSKLTFPSTAYNKAGVDMTTPRNKQIVFITPELEAQMDVDVLASAFNMSRTEFLGSVVVIDAFPTGMDKVQALIVDEDFFMIFDRLFRVESIYNPAQMYYNMFMHYWGTYSYTILKNSIAVEVAGA